MVKILGLIDFIAALFLFSIYYKVTVPRDVLIIVAAFLILKGLIFIVDPTSFFDIATGIFLILNSFITLPGLVILGAGLFLGLKSVMSFLANG